MPKRNRPALHAILHKTAPLFSRFTRQLPIGYAYVSLSADRKKKTPSQLITEWNRSAERITGFTSKQVLGKSTAELFSNGVDGTICKRLRSVYSTGKTIDLPGVGLTVGNRKTHLDVSAWKVGKGIGLLFLKSREAAPIDEDFTQSVNILESITDAFFLLDHQWHFAYLSPKSEVFLAKMGLQRESVIGKNMWDLPKTTESKGYEFFQRAMKERVNVEFEEFYPPLKTWFDVQIHPIADGLSVYVRDISKKKLAESAFLKLSNAVEQTADAVFITNLDGRIEYVNPAFEQITGYLRSEVLGKTPGVLKSDEHDGLFFRQLWKQVLSGQTFRATLINRKKNGEQYYADETITPVRDEQGVITHFVASMKDITERKQSEEALRKSEERFRTLVENSSDGIVLLKEDATITYAGPSTKGIIGYSSDELFGRNAFDLVHSDDVNSVKGILDELLKKPGRILSFQFRMQHHDGSWKWFEATGNNLIAEPKIMAVVINYRDISDRKMMEQALQKSEIEYRNLFDRANDAIFIFEPQGETILEANKKACELYGFPKEELIGKSLKDLTKNVERGQEQIQQLLRHQSSRNFETIHFNKDGKPMEMLVNSSVVEYAGRTAIMSIIRDITELRSLEHQLRHAQKMESIGTLAGGIAHDFNNILSIIMGYTSLIKRGKVEGAKLTESVETIGKAAQRGAVLVKQILTFAHKTDVVFESVRINEILKDLSALLGETFPKTIAFNLLLEENLPTIIADSNQLHQVFMNLCVNARDAMPNRGTVTIRTGLVHGTTLQTRFSDVRQSEYVHVAVSDDGTGMDEETRSRIFEPFFTTKTQGRGTGLGLAVVYGIVNNHHGFIDVESRLGKGTTFHLFFPIQMSGFEAFHRELGTAEEIPGGTETILVVEDEVMLQDLVKRLLEGHGYKVITAHDGAEAVEIYNRQKDSIGLVLTDIGLPKLSGWDVCRKIMELNPRAKVVLASGYLDPNAKSDLKDSQAMDFIHKPYLPEDVLKRIRDALDGRK